MDAQELGLRVALGLRDARADADALPDADKQALALREMLALRDARDDADAVFRALALLQSDGTVERVTLP